MKLLRMKTLGMLGIGFLAGSRAGRGPWEKAQQGVGQLKGKLNHGGDSAPMSMNGAPEGQRGQTSPQLTEI
jgi:hypothetical protein